MSDDIEESEGKAKKKAIEEEAGKYDLPLDLSKTFKGTPFTPEDKAEAALATARREKDEEVERLWKTPEYITWGMAILIWYLLNAFVVRQTFNPHFPDIERHEWYDEDSKQYFDDWAILDDGGDYFIYPDKWRDARTRKVYTFKHPDVISGIRWGKSFRGLFTFLCGLPVVCFYYFRNRQYSTDPEYLRAALQKKLLWCVGVALVLGFAGTLAWDLVQTIGGMLICGAIVLPFFLWFKRHLLFGKKKADETVD
jgi:hypothetical protein